VEATDPIPGQPGSHAWILDQLKRLGEAQLLDGESYTGGWISWEVTRADRWATIRVTWTPGDSGEDVPEEVTHEWRMVPVDREERRKVDGSRE
jgi:hypothetical protein